MTDKDDPCAYDMGSTPIFTSLCEQFANRNNDGLLVGAEEVPVSKEHRHDDVDLPTNPVAH